MFHDDDDSVLKDKILESLVEHMEDILSGGLKDRTGLGVQVSAADPEALKAGLDKAKDVVDQHGGELSAGGDDDKFASGGKVEDPQGGPRGLRTTALKQDITQGTHSPAKDVRGRDQAPFTTSDKTVPGSHGEAKGSVSDREATAKGTDSRYATGGEVADAKDVTSMPKWMDGKDVQAGMHKDLPHQKYESGGMVTDPNEAPIGDDDAEDVRRLMEAFKDDDDDEDKK